jgi:capsular exopolysaccharide synthesis family protein
MVSLRRRRGVFVDPASFASEPFRTLRLAVQLRRDSSRGNCLLMTSAEPGVGKSTLAINYARVCALSGGKALLIDGDLRAPTLHTRLGVRREPGLVELLADTNGSVSSYAKRTLVRGLDLLPAGHPMPLGSDLVSSPRMHQILQFASAMYDVVLIDSPPVLAGSHAEAFATHSMVDVLLVATAQSKRRAIATAVRKLELLDANIIGSVLNRQKQTDVDSYGYGYGYGTGGGANGNGR